jgi:hypothetical protein
MDFLKKKENKVIYSSEEVQFLMYSYLRRKGLLTSKIYQYLSDYWNDIIFLVNNPKGENMPSNIPNDYELDAEEAV